MFETVGKYVVDFVLGVSDLLRETHSPGVVSAVLVALLLLVVIFFGCQTFRRRRALNKLQDIFAKEASNPAEFHNRLSEVNRKIKEIAPGRPSSPLTAVATAWKEYGETFIRRTEGGQTLLSNSVRPSQFFNLDDLHFGTGFWRVWPGLFVTVGLFLTFLGLISALQAMNNAEDVSEEAMANLISVASAKFIMSLTGLACSIVFTVVLRKGMGMIEKSIHVLNRVIEERLSFLSLEQLAVDQLEATREQRDHFRSIGLELVAELERPLREQLPKTISESIGNAMSPLIEQVGKLGTESVGDMVQNLSHRITTDIDGALARASEQLSIAGDRLGTLVDRMDGSSGRMGSEMERASERLAQAVEDLRATMAAGADATSSAFSDGVESILAAMRTTLEGIRENTGEGARAMAEAAAEMHDAAQRLRDELRTAAEEGAVAARTRMDQTGKEVGEMIGGTGEQVRSAIEGTGRVIAEIAGEVTAKASHDLLVPIGEVAQQINDMVAALETGVQHMRLASNGVKDGANAASEASGNFRSAASALVAAGDEVKPAVDRIETATKNLAASTRDVGDSTRRNTASAEKALEAAQRVLGGQEQAIQSTLAGLSQILERIKGQGDRLDDMDRKLGGVFEEYRSQVEGAVGSLRNHVKDIQERLTPALDTMREIVAQMEPFEPESDQN